MFKKVAFIGAGSMAEAIITGVIGKGFLQPKQIYVTNKENQERLSRLRDVYNVVTSSDKKEVVKNADIVILSMKPKDVKEGIESVKNEIKENQLVVSVLAGISTDFITAELGKNVPVIRAMPNTSATIGFSATAIAAGEYAYPQHVEAAKQLFTNIGTTTVVDEDDLHAVTGISGSGPAYIYYLVEAMETAAKQAGLQEKVSKELIVQTLVGAAEMLKTTNERPEDLRKKITSPGGTTQAGLETLQKYNYQEALIECVKSATERSQELGRPYQRNPSL
ncbi:pyrroline-5-carboxylate reductase [Salinibacillus xinjiangensis]|uniref:Pyrroline-5-carboxylate reductase n=1 Tax=Salinibacillus xinjiangensis TaxID=1229268 RepID=A0A6G1XAC8_9BACI|nr:pyrroline-5-carboxylate reductase [Salinibacillus xinjiangensis]MRG87934.1 pyrroline-5-carboxylate reductase [Salinibacillus xinjiangensis]